MINKNATSFRNDIYNLLENTIKYNEPVNITTKSGNAILLSESDYNNMVESLNLLSIPGMKEKIIDGLNTSIEECVSENEVEW